MPNPTHMPPAPATQPPRQPQEDIDLLSLLSPEELEELLGLGSFGARQDLLQDEMAGAQQLQRPGVQRSTPVGAALGSLANVIGAGVGGSQADVIRGKQRALLDETDQRRQLMAELMRRQQQAQRFQGNVGRPEAGDAELDPSMMFRLG